MQIQRMFRCVDPAAFSMGALNVALQLREGPPATWPPRLAAGLFVREIWNIRTRCRRVHRERQRGIHRRCPMVMSAECRWQNGSSHICGFGAQALHLGIVTCTTATYRHIHTAEDDDSVSMSAGRRCLFTLAPLAPGVYARFQPRLPSPSENGPAKAYNQ